MSYFRKNILNVAVVMALITGSVLAVKNFDAVSVVEAVEAKSVAAATMIGETVDPVRKKWQQMDIDGKIVDIQHKTRPIGHKIEAKFSPDNIPGANAALWGERNMSLPAMLLILVFGGIFAFMSLAGPSSMLGGRH